MNYPRLPQRTPYEFLPEMGELFSKNHEDLNTITEAYLHVRYGELPETREDLEAVETAWSRLQAAGSDLKRLGASKLKRAEVQEVERHGV